MRRTAVLAAGALLGAAPAAAQAPGHGHHGGPAGGGTAVAIGFGTFAPATVDVLAGDRVTWTNTSVRRHDVAAVDSAWASGTLGPNGAYARAFDTPGTVAYLCRIHPFMRASVGVHELLLDAPREAGAPGRPFTLRGRTSLAPGTAIGVEADEGAGFAMVARTAAGDDGTFAATVRPRTSGRLRAVAGPAASPPVALPVLDRTVTASARRLRGGRWLVTTRAAPVSPGTTVVVQLRLRERFGWWPVRRARLDHRSRARVRVRTVRAVRARVVLTLADGATPLAVSPTLRLGRPQGARTAAKVP